MLIQNNYAENNSSCPGQLLLGESDHFTSRDSSQEVPEEALPVAEELQEAVEDSVVDAVLQEVLPQEVAVDSAVDAVVVVSEEEVSDTQGLLSANPTRNTFN